MQRYSTAGCAGVGSNAIGGGSSIRDGGRTDSSFSSSFSPNSRRPPQLAPYKLKCEKEPLSSRLPPPDFYPQTLNCPEETLTREYLLSGYKETVDGIEEAKEIVLSQVGTLTKPIIIRCKEAIRKHLRSINESRAQKRKAGQSYGVPLSGQLIVKPLVFPELRSCGEDSRKKWIEALSQQHKGLRSLADHIPHGFRKKVLLEVIVRHNVPLLRATWFIKVTYLNQVRPNSGGISSCASDKSQAARTELWTRDVIEYLQYLLDEFVLKNGVYPSNSVRDQLSPTLLSFSSHQRVDHVSSPADVCEPSLQFKWQYMINLIKWHLAEGLLSPPLIIEWVLSQLQEKESLEALELLLPVILYLIDTMVVSQTYVRMFIDVATNFLLNLNPGGMDVISSAKRPHLAGALVEMLRYLLLAVPDIFVTLDCFPLPATVAPDMVNTKFLDGPNEKSSNSKILEAGGVDPVSQDAYCRYLSFGHIAASLQWRAFNLAKIANPTLQGQGVAKLLQALDKAVILGDVKVAYTCLFDDLSSALDEHWIGDVSSSLRSSLKWIDAGSSSMISAIFFLLEWATCDFRDFRSCQPSDIKFTGRKDFSQVYIAVLLLKQRLEDMLSSSQIKTSDALVSRTVVKNVPPLDVLPSGMRGESASSLRASARYLSRTKVQDILQSPGPLHDIVVCWLDQHEVGKGEGFHRVEVLLMELIRHGIFYPQAYVRQLMISGIMDRAESTFDLEKQRKHLRILKQLPGSYLLHILEEAEIAEESQLLEAVHIFSNERKLVLDGISSSHFADEKPALNGPVLFHSLKSMQKPIISKDVSPSSFAKGKNNSRNPKTHFNVKTKKRAQVDDLKLSIVSLLCFPHSCYESNKSHRSEMLEGSTLRGIGSSEMRCDLTDGNPGCEECVRAKRQRISDEKYFFSGVHLNYLEEDDAWWMRKESKSLELLKEEQPKSAKASSRGRQKLVRKTQSLAQLAAARIEGSQGTSTSHVCESKVSCTHHLSSAEGENLSSIDGSKNNQIASIGKSIKKLRWLEKRSIAIWLLKSVKQLVKGNDVISKVSQSFSHSNEKRDLVRWKLREDALSFILYILDVSSDIYLAVKFLIWLLPQVPGGTTGSHLGRPAMMVPRSNENHTIDVGEAFVVAALQRYENTVIALDLLPEILSAAMHRSINMTVSNGRASGSLVFIYARNLLKKYVNLNSVAKWEKSFKSTCDQRLLAELETGARPLDVEFTYSHAGLDDIDDFLRQKIGGRISRAGQSMKEIVQKLIDEAIYGKERKVYGVSGISKFPFLDVEDLHQTAQQIVLGLFDCMRQHRGTTQEWDPSLVAAAVSAVVGNVGPTCNNYQNFSSSLTTSNHVQQIVGVHLACLCLLKEAVGERMNRAFDIALATEASSIISSAYGPAKTRGQFQISPDIHDLIQNSSNDVVNNFPKMISGKSSKAPAAVSALVIGAIVHGITSLERMIAAFRLREGLDFMQFTRSVRSNVNGLARSVGNFKLDHPVDVYVHWFRLLVGNYRTVLDGLVVDILGEANTLALSRMQRMLPLSIAFPLAYSIFAMVIWRPYVFNSALAAREDIQLYQFLSVAISDAIRHQPFRDLCLRDSQNLFDLMASDITEPEFAAILELHIPDQHFKLKAFVPHRARLFLNSIVDCRIPSSTSLQEDGSWLSGRGEARYSEKDGNLRDQLVHVLDTLQPAKFHWQWVELRLLLNEQALIEKIESHNMTLAEAIHSLSPTAENFSLSEDESIFTEIVLTRLLVRPDAASLYSEVFHLLGRTLDEKILLNVKWLLSGIEVLYGRKSLRQRLVSVAQNKGLSTKVQYWKPWGWSRHVSDVISSRDEKKIEANSLEEGEVVEEGHESKKFGKDTFQAFDGDMFNSSQLYVMDKPLLELVLPCIDRSSSESRIMFATEMIKQLSSIDQHINSLARVSNKQIAAVSTMDVSAKGSNRKGIRGGSPGLGRRSTGSKDSSPPSVVALRASIWLRLQFLLRLFPIIYADREQQSARNSKHIFSSVLLHLLGSPVVYEDMDASTFSLQRASSRRDSDAIVEASVRQSLDLSGDSLFDRIISILHGLLSGSRPGWLKGRSVSKSVMKSSQNSHQVDRELIEHLQAELDRMQLPSSVRWRLQSAMPVLFPSPPPSISCQPPVLSSKFLSSLHLLFWTSGNQDTSLSMPQRAIPVRSGSNASGKNKPSLVSDSEIEIDTWTLLEDGTGSISINSGGSSGSSIDQSNLKACHWLKGSVRVRRTDITYVGTMDEDS